jgi:hypothetical protein
MCRYGSLAAVLEDDHRGTLTITKITDEAAIRKPGAARRARAKGAASSTQQLAVLVP